MPAYEPVIGLEVHAQLLTASKIFCGCSTRFGAPPNAHGCPVCLGLPGALPVLNRTAVDYAIRAALALGCTINDGSIFARKNYFYPDLPKGYQISQYERPLATDGVVEYPSGGAARRVRIIRVHLEEDAGKSLHEGFPDSDRQTYVDFNRSGVPLIEIVTHPDVRSAADAAEFFSRLRAILVWLGVNDGNMEEGSLRCDANVSVRPAGTEPLGTKAEVKNLNSFRFLQKALEYEIERQIDVLAEGGRVVQETRLWDPQAGHTVSMRSKEDAHDYRYFPDPDLPPVSVDAERVARIRAAMPELPDARRARFMEQYALPAYDAATLVDTSRATAEYFEAVVRAGASPKLAANWVMGAVRAKLNELGTADLGILARAIPPEHLGGLIRLIEAGTISGSMAKDVFEKMFASSQPADAIVQAEGLAQIDDESRIDGLIADVLANHPDAVAQYRGGKTAAFGFFVGKVMKAAGGKANPARVNERLNVNLTRADVIETHHLSKFYNRGVYALRDLTLSIDKGEFVFLTGPSGAGKSTLLSLLLCEEKPSEGDVTVAGRRLSDLRAVEVQAYRRTVGFVFQDFRLIPRMTVFQNVAFVMRVLGVDPGVQQRKTFQVLKWVGLQHRMNAQPEELSGGEQQRVAVARALVNDPQIVLADEPTGNLDPDLSIDIMNLFRDINARGTTVLVATHDRELIRRVGRRTITLDHGHVVEVAG